ncbi:uncharacterized protein [Oscarella lobularis]|uniref:uncharacterized protein isoform X1 n=1 Tax=Oscarella lobularis TaxID=121494 RepID=UPI003313FA6A
MTSERILRLLEKGRFWCAFSKAALRTLPPHLKSRIRLLVIFNLIGFNEEAGVEVRFELKRIAEILQNEFGDTFEISGVLEMDCSKRQSDRMNDCRKKLKYIREKMLETADDVPKLCHAIEQYLSPPNEKRKNPLAYFLTADEFEKWVAEKVGIKLAEDEKKVAVEYLDSSGIIINIGCRICLQPIWLCHSVIGPLLAPPYFVVAMPAIKSGRASKKDIQSALTNFGNYLKQKGNPSPFVVTADEAIEILRYLELCVPIENEPEVYQIPALLDDSIPRDAWVEDPMLDVYRGQRYECARCVDIISPSSFVAFQCRCSFLENVSHRAWKDGVKLVKIVGDKVIECLIETGIKKEHCCIDVILRWSSKADCEREAKEFLDELKAMIAKACDERSPGVILNWFYLDSTHLKQLDEDPAIYSSSEVDHKINARAFNNFLFSTRPEKWNRSSIRDLVIMEEKPESTAVSVDSPPTRFLTGARSEYFPDDDELSDHVIMEEKHEHDPVSQQTFFASGTRSDSPAKDSFSDDDELVSDQVIMQEMQEHDPVSQQTSFASGAHFDSPAKDSFPGDDELLTDQVITACSRVRGSLWEEIGACVIDLDAIKQIRDDTRSHPLRMKMVFDSWKTAKSPTVGELLHWFEEVGVNRTVIKTKYKDLYGLFFIVLASCAICIRYRFLIFC